MRKLRFFAVLLVFIALLSGCTNGGGDSPATATENFWEAVRSGGAQASKPHISQESQMLVDGGMQMSLSGNYELGDVEITGDRATVVTIDSDSPERDEFTTFLVKEEGEWKVDLPKTMQSIMKNMPGT